MEESDETAMMRGDSKPSNAVGRRPTQAFGEPAQFYGTIVGPLGRRSGGKEESGKTNP